MEDKNVQELKKEEQNTQEVNQDTMEKVSGGATEPYFDPAYWCDHFPHGARGPHFWQSCSNSEAGISAAESFIYVGYKCTFCGRTRKKYVQNTQPGYR